MSLPVILIILFALLLVVLLAWALRPPTRQIKLPLDVFEKKMNRWMDRVMQS